VSNSSRTPHAATADNGFTSAALKNAIDWLSRSGAEGTSPLKGKPFAVVSAGGGGGGMRAQRNICAIASDFKMPQVGGETPIAVKLFDGVNRFDKATGDLSDPAVKAAIEALVAQLAAAAAAHKAAA
jgi:NAD(P)H-dependent FMN reductase